MHLKRLYISVLFIAVASLSMAQRADSSGGRNNFIKFKNQAQFDRTDPEYQYLDTLMEKLEIYHPMYRKLHIFQDLGNIGSPVQSLIFNNERPTDFRLGIDMMQPYMVKAEDARFYQTRKPYTDMHYVQGPNNLLVLNALHTQNISRRWNAGLQFRRITSEGFYLNQKTSIWNSQLFTSYRSSHKKYQLLASISWNKGFTYENGGITNDSAFEAASGVTKRVNVNLLGTGANGNGGPYNKFRDHVFAIKQYWNFGRSRMEVEGKDTLHPFYSSSYISHETKLELQSYQFRDNDLFNKSYYPDFFFDTLKTFDSIHHLSFENSISFFSGRYNRHFREKAFFLLPSVTHKHVEVWQRSSNRVFNNISLQLNVSNNPGEKTRLDMALDAAYCIEGYNRNDFRLRPVLRYRFLPMILEASWKMQQYEPDYITQKFISNHYIWQNNFDKTSVQELQLNLSTRAWRNNAILSFTQSRMENLVIYGTDTLPRQISDAISVQVLRLAKTIQVGHFKLENNIYYQQSSNKKALRLPEFSAFERLCYENRFFNKVMRLQAGFDFFYNSAFYANAYQPVSRQFHLQDSVKTGNYPLLDVFLNLHIKRAALMFKLEHLNSSFSNGRYYSSPHYPLPPRAFRFGIVWRFYD